MTSYDSHTHRPKLVILQTHPIQYYAPLYRTLAQRGRIDITVFYLSDAGVNAHHDPGFGQKVAWDIPLLEGYKHQILQPDSGITDRSFWRRHDDRLGLMLAEERPDWILLYGYASRMNWGALSWAKENRVRVAYSSDSNIRLMRHDWRMLAKQVILRWFFSKIDVFLSSCDANLKYLEFFGASTAKIIWCPFAIEFERFKSAGPIGTKNAVNFVWAGKMITLKRPDDFIRALNELVRRGHQQVSALMIGSGPLLDSICKAAEQFLPKGTIEVAGFINQKTMPSSLQRGNIFVFTSERDAYGLAVTEAAACGLGLIVADVNGCVGRNGIAQPATNALTYPAGDVQALADCMEVLLTNPERLKLLQDASLAIAAKHDVSQAAAIIEAIVIGDRIEHA